MSSFLWTGIVSPFADEYFRVGIGIDIDDPDRELSIPKYMV
jgi:hypothetical protein